MKNDYPSFESLETRREYTNIIKRMFDRSNFPWTASSNVTTPQVLVKPNDSLHWEKFPNVLRMSVSTLEGVMRFGVKGMYSPDKASYKKTLEDKGYVLQQNPDSNSWWLIKPLENLESLVWEIGDIEHDLLKG